MPEFLTTEGLAKSLHCDKRKVGWFRKYGLIEGIKTGKGYVFMEDEIQKFWNTYKGLDLSNEQKIRIAAVQQKKSS
jgi:hypothetical protein